MSESGARAQSTVNSNIHFKIRGHHPYRIWISVILLALLITSTDLRHLETFCLLSHIIPPPRSNMSTKGIISYL